MNKRTTISINQPWLASIPIFQAREYKNHISCQRGFISTFWDLLVYHSHAFISHFLTKCFAIIDLARPFSLYNRKPFSNDAQDKPSAHETLCAQHPSLLASEKNKKYVFGTRESKSLVISK